MPLYTKKKTFTVDLLSQHTWKNEKFWFYEKYFHNQKSCSVKYKWNLCNTKKRCSLATLWDSISLIISITWTNSMLEQEFLWQPECKGQLLWQRQTERNSNRMPTPNDAWPGHCKQSSNSVAWETAKLRIGGKKNLSGNLVWLDGTKECENE